MSSGISSAANPTAHSTLLAGLERGDDASIEQAFARLELGLAPNELMALVKATVVLGLGSLAGTLVRTVGAPLLADPAVARLAEQLDRLPTGIVPQHGQQQNVRANRAVIGGVIGSVTLPGLEEALHDDTIVPLRDRQGRVQLTDRVGGSDGTHRMLVPFAFNAPSEWLASFGSAWPPVTALAGVPLPQLLAALIAARKPSHLPAKLLVFETDVRVIAAWLRAADLTRWLLPRTVECHFGGSAVADYLQSIDQSLAVPPAQRMFVIRREPLAAQGSLDLCRISQQRWTLAHRAWTERARRRAAQRPIDERARRFRAAARGEQSLTVAGFVCSHTTVVGNMMRELLAAFAANGHTTLLMTEPDPSMPLIDLTRPFADHDIDCVIGINYLRRHPTTLVPIEVPYVCWMQDLVNEAQTPEAGASQGAMDLLVAHSGGFFDQRFGYPTGQSIDAPNLTSWATYGAIGDTPRESGAPDVVYIGHGWESAEDLARTCGDTATALDLLLDASRIFRERLARNEVVPGFERMRVQMDLLRARGIAPPRAGHLLYWTIQSLYDRLFRHQALDWAARWCAARGRRFAIYGKGWEQHPTLGQYAAGVVENGPALGRLCRDAGVVLHANGNASLHQRLLDGIAAGGCVLTRWNPADDVPRFARQLQHQLHATSVKTLRAAMERDAALREVVSGFEASLGCTVAANRDADRAAIRATGLWPLDTLEDAAFYRQLSAANSFLTPHGAADLDGFHATTYRSADELASLLDRVFGSPGERDALRLPLRGSVQASFTMEWLASAIVAKMSSMLERATA